MNSETNNQPVIFHGDTLVKYYKYNFQRAYVLPRNLFIYSAYSAYWLLGMYAYLATNRNDHLQHKSTLSDHACHETYMPVQAITKATLFWWFTPKSHSTGRKHVVTNNSIEGFVLRGHVIEVA